MGGRMSRQSLQLSAHVDQLLHRFIAVIQRFQIRIHRKRLVQRHIQLGRDHLGDLVPKAVGKIHHPGHIPNHALSCERSEGDDLHHPILSVLFGHIINHILPSLIFEIHVDIGHGDSLRI